MELHILLIYILAYVGLFTTSFYALSMASYYRKKDNPSEAEDKSVSIVIPAHNEEKDIAKTIKSAMGINYPKGKLEVIVVDDGSTDSTYAIAKSFPIAVFTKKRGGKGAALNYGIGQAKNEIIITMDADTIAEPDAVRKMMAHFHNDTVVSVTPSIGVYQPKGLLGRVQQIEYYLGVFMRKTFATVNAIYVTPGAFAAYRKSFFEKHGLFEENNITEDLEIALRIQSKKLAIENAPKAVVYTMAPEKFGDVLVQRKRWYVGLIKNMWNYRHLYGFEYGTLGKVILPTATISVLLAVAIMSYAVIRSLAELQKDIVLLQSINFAFYDAFEISVYSLQSIFLHVFSEPAFIFSFLFIFIIGIYLHFSRRQMLYKEGVIINFALFILLFSLLFVFWWILSFFSAIFSKNVKWRNEDA